jgi:hypothetical protein
VIESERQAELARQEAERKHEFEVAEKAADLLLYNAGQRQRDDDADQPS